MISRIVRFTCAFLTLCTMSSAVIALDRVVAVVDEKVITQSELNDRMNRTKKQYEQSGAPMPPHDVLATQVLDRLIDQELMQQQAERMGIIIDDAMLDETMTKIAGQNNQDLETFKKTLLAEGYDLEEFQAQIRRDIAIAHAEKKLGLRVYVSDQEVEQRLNEMKKQRSPNTKYRLGHILITLPENPTELQLKAAQETAKQTIGALKKGEKFQQVALMFSDSTDVLQSTDLGWRTEAELPTLFVKDVPKMEIKHVAGPFRNAAGLHVIQLLEMQHDVPLAMQREYVKKQLFDEKYQEMSQNWVTQLRSQAHIEIKEPI